MSASQWVIGLLFGLIWLTWIQDGGASQESPYEIRKRQLTAELASIELKLNQKKKQIQSKRRTTAGGSDALDQKKSRRRKFVEADLDHSLGNDGNLKYQNSLVKGTNLTRWQSGRRYLQYSFSTYRITMEILSSALSVYSRCAWTYMWLTLPRYASYWKAGPMYSRAHIYAYLPHTCISHNLGDPRILEEFESQGRKYLQQIQKDRTTASVICACISYVLFV